MVRASASKDSRVISPPSLATMAFISSRTLSTVGVSDDMRFSFVGCVVGSRSESSRRLRLGRHAGVAFDGEEAAVQVRTVVTPDGLGGHLGSTPILCPPTPRAEG